jgi:hypothetical protein
VEYLFLVGSLGVPSFFVLLFLAAIISVFAQTRLLPKIMIILVSVAISLFLQVFIATMLVVSTKSAQGYSGCVPEPCQGVTFSMAIEAQIGLLWFYNMILLTAPTFVISLIPFGILLALGYAKRKRVEAGA